MNFVRLCIATPFGGDLAVAIQQLEGTLALPEQAILKGTVGTTAIAISGEPWEIAGHDVPGDIIECLFAGQLLRMSTAKDVLSAIQIRSVHTALKNAETSGQPFATLSQEGAGLVAKWSLVT